MKLFEYVNTIKKSDWDDEAEKEWREVELNQKLRKLVEKYSKLDAFGGFCEQLLHEMKNIE